MANPENTANAPASAPTDVPSTDARAQFEAERMTRRAALRKFGFGAGMAALLALSTDDLARMAAAKLKQHAGDNRVANQVANEFKNAGVVFANTLPGHTPVLNCQAETLCSHQCWLDRGAEVEAVCHGLTGSELDGCIERANVNWCKCIKETGCNTACASTMPDQCSTCTSSGC